MNPENKLLEMLTWMRPHDSATEEAFCEKYILDPLNERVMTIGPMSNFIITIGEDSKTLFSCHTDTVHHDEGMQLVIYDPIMGMAYKNDNACLGADDTTGVWLMLEMIEANVPGTYIFHRGEERGGVGSYWIANNEVTFLKQFKRAIAFDRKGETSVITSQRNSPCCSSEFATALAAQLGKEWVKDPTGSFTDTANYTHLIPECTNVSVGYYDAHGSSETQNISFALVLRELCINVDWESLPTVREAKKEKLVSFLSAEPQQQSHNSDFYQQSYNSDFDYDYEDGYEPFDIEEYDLATNAQLATLTTHQLESICRADPSFAAFKLNELLASPVVAIPKYSHEFFERLDEFELALAGFEEDLAQTTEENTELEERVRALEQKTPAVQHPAHVQIVKRGTA